MYVCCFVTFFVWLFVFKYLFDTKITQVAVLYNLFLRIEEQNLNLVDHMLEYISPLMPAHFELSHYTILQTLVLAATLAVAAAAPVYGPVSYGPHLSYGYAAKAIQPLHTVTLAKPIVAAAPLIHHAPVIAHAAPLVKHVEAYDPNPHYSFSYGVADPHTGDSKHAEEHLANGVVHGSYSLTEPDGTIRKVTYTADKIHGFNAVVEKSGHAVHAAPVFKKVVAPIVHAAPIVHYHH